MKIMDLIMSIGWLAFFVVTSTISSGLLRSLSIASSVLWVTIIALVLVTDKYKKHRSKVF